MPSHRARVEYRGDPMAGEIFTCDSWHVANGVLELREHRSDPSINSGHVTSHVTLIPLDRIARAQIHPVPDQGTPRNLCNVFGPGGWRCAYAAGHIGTHGWQ